MGKQGTNPSILEILEETRTFKGADRETLLALIQQAEIRILEPGEALYRPGDEYLKSVFIPYSGDMKVRRRTGGESNTQLGDFLGLANYLDNAPYSSAAIAITRTELLEIKADAFLLLERTHPPLFNALNRVIAHKLRERSPDRGIRSGVLAQPISNVMKSPVATCGEELTLQEAFRIMWDRKISSMVVTGEREQLTGILTCSGVLEAVLLNESEPSEGILKAACQTAHTVNPDTPLWEAEETQRRNGTKYLLVVEQERPIGIVSQSDILRALISQPSTLTTQIPDASTIKELTSFYLRTAETAAEAQEENYRPSAAIRDLSDTHLALQQRAIELTLGWMEKRGHGTPPAGFAVLIMGSGGRREMLLNPDQDNGIIIEDHPESGSPEFWEWFELFCKRMNRNLDRIGYILCPGEIMARNPMYQKTLSQWKKQISYIVQKPNEKAARWSSIVFDFDTLYGDDRLTSELRRHVLHEVRRKPRLLTLMAEHDAEGRPAIGFFNQLIATTKDKKGERIDIKRNGLRIIADAARIFALHNGIAAPNTTDRLAALVRVGALSDDLCTSVSEAYEELLDLLLTHQIKQALEGKALDKLINPRHLTAQTRSTLRMAMRAVKRLQEQLQHEFKLHLF